MFKFNKGRLSLIFASAVACLAVAVAGVSTAAWFQLTNGVSVSNSDNIQTKGVTTTAKVYQPSSHPNDDSYSTTATQDSAGTLSYDHSNGGQGTNYYLRVYNSDGTEKSKFQMSTNTSNSNDKGVYSNISLTANEYFKIYDAASRVWYGYSRFDTSTSVNSNFTTYSTDYVKCTTAGSYDIYFTYRSVIWVRSHAESVTTFEQGDESGYYIVGTTSDPNSSLYGHSAVSSGIPMYVNAAGGSSDLAYYAGLRLSVGDTFKIIEGDLETEYKTAASGSDNLLNKSAYFTVSTTITTVKLGYYTIALNSSEKLYMTEWDGMEVDGSTQYVSTDGDDLIYLDISNTAWSTAYAYSWTDANSDGAADTEQLGSFPGKRMTKVNESSGIWAVKRPASDTKIVFSIGNNTTQTSDQTISATTDCCFTISSPGTGNTCTGSWGTYSATTGKKNANAKINGKGPHINKISAPASNKKRVFFIDQAWWAKDTAYTACHYWGGSSSTEWPGSLASLVNGGSPNTSGGNLWYYDIPSDSTNFMFVRVSSGNEDWGAKTGNLSFQSQNNLYTLSTTTVWGDPGAGGSWSLRYDTSDTQTVYFDVCDASNLQNSLYVRYWDDRGDSNAVELACTEITSSLHDNCFWKAVFPAKTSRFLVHKYNDWSDGSNAKQSHNVTSYNGTYNLFVLSGTSNNNENHPCYNYTNTINSDGAVHDIYFYSKTGSAAPSLITGTNHYQTIGGVSFACSNVSFPSTPTGYQATSTWTRYTYSNSTWSSAGDTVSSTGSFTVSSSVATYYWVAVFSPYTYYLMTCSTVNGTYTSATSATVGNTLELTADLAAGTYWYVHKSTSSGVTPDGKWSDMSSSNLTVVLDNSHSVSSAVTNYFSVGGTNNFYTAYGGNYTITINSSGAITGITINSLLDSNFSLGGSWTDAGGDMSADTTNNLLVWDFDTSRHFRIKAESFYVAGMKGTAKFATLEGGGTYSSYFYTTEGNEVKSYVDCDATISFSFNPASPSSSFITITSLDENFGIHFNHARDAGIYIETADNSSFSNSTVTMMHITTDTETYQAQEAPFYTSATAQDPLYLRIFKTKSNLNNGSIATDADVRAATEEYFYVQETPHSGFSNESDYIAVTVTGNWTISLLNDADADDHDGVKISEYTSSSNIAVEHNVPYWLIGRGMPGSGIRGCDFTIDGGIQLYTYGTNTGSLPAYVGSHPSGNTSSSDIKGTGINLKKGDTFSISSATTVITSVNASNDGKWSSSSGLVTINQSGNYYVYVTSGGVVTLEYRSALVGSPERDSTNSSLLSFTEGYGTSTLNASGTTLNFGAVFDYSLLDAYSTGGYTFFIELAATAPASVSGTMTYTITDGNANYDITVAALENTYNPSGSYSTLTQTTGVCSKSRTIAANATTSTTLKITIAASAIKSILSSNSFTFALTINCAFQESVS